MIPPTAQLTFHSLNTVVQCNLGALKLSVLVVGSGCQACQCHRRTENRGREESDMVSVVGQWWFGTRIGRLRLF